MDVSEHQLKVLALLVAIVGALYTAVQFIRARNWRACDLALSLLRELETDEELSLACRALDWGVGPLIVPSRYRGLVERPPVDPLRPTASERGEVIQIDLELMARALNVRLAFNPASEPEGLIYRYCFDRLFTHLSNIELLLETHQIRRRELLPLAYWLDKIKIYQYVPEENKMSFFQPFLRHAPFGYLPVIQLAEKLGVSGWDWQPPNPI